MDNLINSVPDPRWIAFLNRKKYKFKEFENKWGKSLIVKTYNQSKRCNILISERKIKFSFYTARKLKDRKLTFRTKANICFVKRNNTLNIFSYDSKNGVRNLGLNGPQHFLNFVADVITNDYKYKKNIKICYKLLSLLEFFLKLNKFSIQKIDKDSLLNLCYPSYKNFPFPDNESAKLISQELRKPNLGLHQICQKLFGYKSKIIVKTLLESNTKNIKIQFGFILKRLLNRGQMEKFIQNPNLIEFRMNNDKNHIKVYRKFFQQFTSDQLMHLFSQKYSYFNLNDACAQWYEFPLKITIPITVKTWKNVHDEISNQYRKLGQEDYEFNITPKLKLIHGFKVEAEEIIVPHTRHELIDWGTKMNNCIAGYHGSFNRGETTILGIKNEGKLVYNIEIRNGVINQFMANRNQRANAEVIDRYSKIFKQFKLIS